MPQDSPDRERWHSICVEADERPPARTEDVGYVAVDEPAGVCGPRRPHGLAYRRLGRRTGRPRVLGRDARILAARTGAAALDDDAYGWTDLPVQDAVQRARDLYRAKESEGMRFALDFRPRDDHHRLLSLATAAPTESASAGIGGYVVCGFFTSWGDAAFPVRDSGWRVLAGDESDDPGNIAVMPLRDPVAMEAALEPLVRTSAPSAFERGPDGAFVPAEPPSPRD
jgi:Protein of unknown function (DUF2185)